MTARVMIQVRRRGIDRDGAPGDWTPFETLERVPKVVGGARLQFWRDLNADAVKCRGESARCEFRAVEEPHD